MKVISQKETYMQMNDLIKIFGSIPLVVGDILSLMSLLGSSLIFVTALISLAQKKRLRFAEQALQWSFMGLVFGIGTQVCMYASGQIPEQLGFFVRLSPEIVNLILLLASCLLILGFLIRRVATSRAGYTTPTPVTPEARKSRKRA
jgi:hypothetical protein